MVSTWMEKLQRNCYVEAGDGKLARNVSCFETYRVTKNQLQLDGRKSSILGSLKEATTLAPE